MREDVNAIAVCKHPLYWHQCYRGTYDLIAPESFAHPAKMAPALCFKILQHLKELGLLKNEDTILDPMSGTGMTNICAGALGYKSISVELEDKFVGFQKQNKEYAERRLYMPLDWQMIKGDSRKLSELLGRNGLKSITSPPYESSLVEHGENAEQEVINKLGAAYMTPGRIASHKRMQSGYSNDPNNIGNLSDKPLKSVMSPPHGLGKGTGHADNKRQSRPILIDRNVHLDYNDDNPDNIGNLSDKPLKSVMSPPYDGHPSASNGDPHPERQQSKPAGRQYGESDGQIGKEQQESYLGAMEKVYGEIAKVSDVLVVVVKNPTRNKTLRRLDLDTIAILKESGWNIHCQHRALLFEELKQADLFEGSKKQVKGRLSFFKRLSWQNGQPVANWEDILICVRN